MNVKSDTLLPSSSKNPVRSGDKTTGIKDEGLMMKE
jgi:hypothetical protein